MDLSGVYARGEGGLMGLVVHPDFAQSRLFTTCLNFSEGGTPVDIRLVTWRLSDTGTSAEKVKDLLTGLPRNVSGRHSGCRPTLAADGALLVGTGDTADGRIPQDLTSLGGKVLRIDLPTGEGLADNPFADAADAHQRRIYTYGHRNVQGVAVRPGTGQVFTAEHGPAVDDEVNLLTSGGNYGWDPSRGGTVGGTGRPCRRRAEPCPPGGRTHGPHRTRRPRQSARHPWACGPQRARRHAADPG